MAHCFIKIRIPRVTCKETPHKYSGYWRRCKGSHRIYKMSPWEMLENKDSVKGENNNFMRILRGYQMFSKSYR